MVWSRRTRVDTRYAAESGPAAVPGAPAVAVAVAGLRFTYPDGSVALDGIDLTVREGAGGAPRTQRCGQDHPDAASERGAQSHVR